MIKESHKYNDIQQISRLIIIDRECDYISPLLSQHTYSGLIDETFKIKDNCIKIPTHMFNSKNIGDFKLKDKIINSNDIIYELLKDKTIYDASKIITEKVTELYNINKSIDMTNISSTNH